MRKAAAPGQQGRATSPCPELTCPTADRGDRFYISLQIGVFYDNHLHGNQVSRH